MDEIKVREISKFAHHMRENNKTQLARLADSEQSGDISARKLDLWAAGGKHQQQ